MRLQKLDLHAREIHAEQTRECILSPGGDCGDQSRYYKHRREMTSLEMNTNVIEVQGD